MSCQRQLTAIINPYQPLPAFSAGIHSKKAVKTCFNAIMSEHPAPTPPPGGSTSPLPPLGSQTKPHTVVNLRSSPPPLSCAQSHTLPQLVKFQKDGGDDGDERRETRGMRWEMRGIFLFGGKGVGG